MSDKGNGTPPPAQPEFSDSDQAWFAALSGQPAPRPESPAAREGLALRAALHMEAVRLERQASVPVQVDVDDDEAVMQERLRKLNARLDAEPAPAVRLRKPRAPSNVIAFPWWRSHPATWAMAASFLVAAVLVGHRALAPDFDREPQTMGGDGVQQRVAASPKTTAAQFTAQLRAVGLRPGQYQRDKIYIVDINLVASELPLAAPAFQAQGLQPALGFNRVEFSPR